ncbi:hypothetical protein [Sphingobacterium sp.]|jgi:hypothetical protein|uniref:hypothetical protein n=1 Tax=Sphingobacterium sp. TaxID=341027 RepID=UPI0028A15FD6|nr:hypothetical protein [Sphingobacterium sp.]
MKKISVLILTVLGLWGCGNSNNKGNQANGSYDSSTNVDDGQTGVNANDSLGRDSTDSLQRQPSPAKPD